MTTTNRSPDAVFDRHLAAWETRQPAPEGWGQRVETAARAGCEAVQSAWPTGDGPWSEHEREFYRSFAAAALTADAAHAFEPGDNLSDHPKATQSGDGDALHADLCELLNALGLGAYARPYSAHEVMQRDVIPMARSLRTAYDAASQSADAETRDGDDGAVERERALAEGVAIDRAIREGRLPLREPESSR